MKEWLKNNTKKIVEWVYRNFEKDTGSMILVTTTIGYTLSAIAQSLAVFLNKKYTTNEKHFMIPQEIAECGVNIFSLFAITMPLKALTNKYSQTGKLMTKGLKEYMQKNNLWDKRGKLSFNLGKSIEEIIKKIEKSEQYIKASETEKEALLKEHRIALNNHEIMSDSYSSVVTTMGSVFSTALVAPLFRNEVASYVQKFHDTPDVKQPDVKQIPNNKTTLTVPAFKSVYAGAMKI